MLKENDKVYSFYTHREGVIDRIKWETAIVKWNDGGEELVPLGTLKKIPTKEEIKDIFSFYFRKRVPIKNVISSLEKEYGDKVFSVLEDVIDEFTIQPGDVYMDNKERVAKVISIKDNLVNIEWRDGNRERISKDRIIGNFKKIEEEE